MDLAGTNFRAKTRARALPPSSGPLKKFTVVIGTLSSQGKKDNKGKGKEGEKLPTIGKKKEQEKKQEKKQDKKTETAKEEQDTSQKDVEELHRAIHGNELY